MSLFRITEEEGVHSITVDLWQVVFVPETQDFLVRRVEPSGYTDIDHRFSDILAAEGIAQALNGELKDGVRKVYRSMMERFLAAPTRPL